MNAERLLVHYEQIADGTGAIGRLRSFILDLAVRGKLVPQNPNDEPASELPKHIAKEKARLAKAGEIKTPKALSEIEGPPFDLPQNWRWTRIREVASDRGQEIPRSTFTYIDVTAIDKEAGVVASPKVLEAGEAPSRARKITRKGDVIYSCVRPYLLNVAVIETDFNPQPIASTAFAVLNGHGLVLPRYLWIVLRCPFMVALVEENQRGQAYPAINDADFAVLPFPLPPLAEQHRIVAKVDELMALCDQLETARVEREAVRDRLAAASLARLNAPDPATFRADARFLLNALPAITTRPDQIRQLRQTILNLAVRGELVKQDPKDKASQLPPLRQFAAASGIDDEVFEQFRDSMALPRAWQIAPLAQLSENIIDCPHTTPKWTDHGEVCVRTNQLRPRFLDLSEPRYVSPEAYLERIERLEPKEDDILYSREGGILGIACRVPKGIRLCLGQRLMLIRAGAETRPDFLEIVLNSPFITDIAKERTTGGAAPRVNMSTVRAYPIPLPPLAEQKRIVDKVDALMVLCDRLGANLNASAATRRRLLDALLAEALAPREAREMEAAE
jgi:type I restriction enzyme, S subunit